MSRIHSQTFLLMQQEKKFVTRKEIMKSLCPFATVECDINSKATNLTINSEQKKKTISQQQSFLSVQYYDFQLVKSIPFIF